MLNLYLIRLRIVIFSIIRPALLSIADLGKETYALYA